jgi:dipeptidyl-peptidase-4
MYPEQDSFKYPKVGAPNSIVSVHLYNLVDHTTGTIMGLETDDYVPRIHWTTGNQLVITRLTRMQETLELLMAMPERSMYDDSDHVTYIPIRPIWREDNKAYIDIHDNMVFLKNNEFYLWSNESSGYNRLYLNSLLNKTGVSPVPLTQANMDMTAFYGVDEKNGKFYYQTASPTPMDRQVWEGDLKGGDPQLLGQGPGTWEASFSPNFDFYTLRWSDLNTPPVAILYARGGTKVRLISENARVKRTVKEYGFVEKKFWSFKLADGTTLNGWTLEPPVKEAGKKYPVLFDVYGGPGSQTVQNQYDGYMDPWRQMLVQKGIIVVSVDNRGTGGRGEAFKKCTQLQLGKYETEDQIAAARYLATLPYIDPLRIGIWGWSFGGYLSTSCILKGNTTFKMAMAVAPVTNWKWYDSAYTERYMHTSQDNAGGYESNSPVNFANLLRGGNYLICHGIADDNVHWQQTVEMINALIKANKQFETVYYPNRNHGIYGDNATIHLFTKLTQFVQDKL